MSVHRVSVPYDSAPTGSVNSYLVDGEQVVLVDVPTRDAKIDALLADRTLDAITVTHHHPDHAGGVAAYAREHDARVYCRVGRAAAFADATGIEPTRTVGPGDRVANTLTVYETPGHAPEHLAFACEAGLLSGDLAVAEGSVAVAAPEGDLRAYLASLRRVHADAPPRLYPGHGPVITEVRATCERLLRHRLERERRVIAAVESGARTLEAVTDAAYDKDVSAVRELAEATIEAHLEKLAAAGRIRRDGTRVWSA